MLLSIRDFGFKLKSTLYACAFKIISLHTSLTFLAVNIISSYSAGINSTLIAIVLQAAVLGLLANRATEIYRPYLTRNFALSWYEKKPFRIQTNQVFWATMEFFGRISQISCSKSYFHSLKIIRDLTIVFLHHPLFLKATT